MKSPAAFLASAVLFALSGRPAFSAGVSVADVRAEQDEKGLVHVRYVLKDAAAQGAQISLKLSADRGRTFRFFPQAVTGDVGSIAVSGEKEAVWDMEKDHPELKGRDFVFAVEAVSTAEFAAAKREENAPGDGWYQAKCAQCCAIVGGSWSAGSGYHGRYKNEMDFQAKFGCCSDDFPKNGLEKVVCNGAFDSVENNDCLYLSLGRGWFRCAR